MTTNSIPAGAYFLSNSLHSTDRKYTSFTLGEGLTVDAGERWLSELVTSGDPPEANVVLVSALVCSR